MSTFILSLFTVHFNKTPNISKPGKLLFLFRYPNQNFYALVPSQSASPYLRRWIRVLLKELRFSQMFRNFRQFIEHKFPYHVYNSPKIVLNLMPIKLVHFRPFHFLNTNFNIILNSKSNSCKWFPFLRFTNQTQHASLLPPLRFSSSWTSHAP